MTRARLRQLLFLMMGWAALIVGLLILPLPVLLPFPVGVVLVLVGLAVLSAHSRMFRQFVRQARHRHLWLSRGFETFGARAPRSVKTMVHRTRPAVVERHARRQAARAGV